CCENKYFFAAAIAALTRLPSSSILPKRSCGSEPIPVAWGSGELTSISSQLLTPLQPGRSRSNRSYDLRRQTKTHVLGHHFEFLHVGESFIAQKAHCFFHQMLWGRSASGQCNRLYALKPLRLDIVATVD